MVGRALRAVEKISSALADLASEKLIQREIDGLPANVPQRHVDARVSEARGVLSPGPDPAMPEFNERMRQLQTLRPPWYASCCIARLHLSHPAQTQLAKPWVARRATHRGDARRELSRSREVANQRSTLSLMKLLAPCMTFQGALRPLVLLRTEYASLEETGFKELSGCAYLYITSVITLMRINPPTSKKKS